ncbi:hypothetical protein [Paraburkholderia sp. Cy-641]|uniref:hypothetical protein n=1 Tax=Paraburkholderia sp. Cy-641 TaxID=2608337 RepID=UPI001F043A16|nr:hypothetical protein [Paraburkholderia sp. Cy-641]
MDDRQHALDQVEVHAANGRQTAEFLADQRFLGRAVHLHDADGGAQVVADSFGTRQAQWRRRERGGGAAGAVGVIVGVSRGLAALAVVPVRVIVAMLMAVAVSVPLMPFSAVSMRVLGVRMRVAMSMSIMPTAAARAAFVTAFMTMSVAVLLRVRLPVAPMRTGLVRFRTIGGKTADFRHGGFLVRFVV